MAQRDRIRAIADATDRRITMLSYETYLGGTRVLLEGKRVGVIVRVPSLNSDAGFQYQPTANRKFSGEVFSNLGDCKRSLEND